MGKFLASITAIVGGLVALVSSGACFIVFLDEPDMPKSLIR